MAMWDNCAICGRAIPIGEPCYGVKNWRGDPIGGDTICRDCLVLENVPTLTPPNEWVSVEDRLPASGQNVIATNGSDVGEAWYASLSRSWYRYNGLEWNRICREVTHWMPLPEPPDSRQPEGEV